jgi:hypothetical protein
MGHRGFASGALVIPGGPMPDVQIYDQFGSVIRTVHTHADGSVTLANTADYEEVIRQNAAERDQITGKETFRKVATVPVHEVERAMREGWFHDDKAWERWLNDRDNRDFRVWEGRV